MKRKGEEKNKCTKRQKISASSSGWLSSLFSYASPLFSSFFEEDKKIEKDEDKKEDLSSLLQKTLPEEIITHIGTFLPSYHYAGEKALPLVCHQFNRIFHGSTRITQGKRTKESIIDACYTLEDTLHVFSDPTLCKQFSFEELMSMAGKHARLALHILKSDDITFDTFDFISKLAQHDLTVAQTILDSPSLHRALLFSPPSKFDIIGQLNQSYPRFRKMYALFSSPHTPPLLKIIAQLGQYHPSIAWKAFTPDLENNLTSQDLAFLAPSSPDILQHIMRTPALFDKIDHIMLPSITKNCPETAMQFFKGERTLSHPAPSDVEAFYSKCLLATHLDIAREVMAMDIKKILAELGEERSYVNIISISMNDHLEMVSRILNNAAWCDELNGTALALLGNQHLDVANYILDTDALAQKLSSSDLMILGTHHAKIAWRIFHKLELERPLLHTASLPYLWILFHNHPDMIRHVLNTPHLSKLIPTNTFEPMCKHHLESLAHVLPTHVHVRNCNALIKLSRSLLKEIQEESKKRNTPSPTI